MSHQLRPQHDTMRQTRMPQRKKSVICLPHDGRLVLSIVPYYTAPYLFLMNIYSATHRHYLPFALYCFLP